MNINTANGINCHENMISFFQSNLIQDTFNVGDNVICFDEEDIVFEDGSFNKILKTNFEFQNNMHVRCLKPTLYIKNKLVINKFDPFNDKNITIRDEDEMSCCRATLPQETVFINNKDYNTNPGLDFTHNTVFSNAIGKIESISHDKQQVTVQFSESFNDKNYTSKVTLDSKLVRKYSQQEPVIFFTDTKKVLLSKNPKKVKQQYTDTLDDFFKNKWNNGSYLKKLYIIKYSIKNITDLLTKSDKKLNTDSKNTDELIEKDSPQELITNIKIELALLNTITNQAKPPNKGINERTLLLEGQLKEFTHFT